MIEILHGAEFHIPDELVDFYMVDFLPLKKQEYRDRLMNLREEILDVFDIVLADPEALYDPEFLQDFVVTLAMRHALYKMSLLHDA